MEGIFSSKVIRFIVYIIVFGTVGGVVYSLEFIPTSEYSTVTSPPPPNMQNGANQYILPPKIPDELEFAGERVPLENFDVRERLDAQLIAGNYYHTYTLLLIKRANRWFPVIEPLLKKNGVPDDFKYLCMIESSLSNAISPKGATGFWQFMKPAARTYGLEISKEIDERYHVEKATEAACRYFKEARTKFGSWTLAAASYNYGFNGVQNQIERQKEKNYYNLILPDETEEYLFRILSAKEVYNHPTRYGFYFEKKDLYPPLEYYEIKITGKVKHWADFARKHGINYRTLKIFNPWLRENYLANRKHKTYKIKIPKEGSITLIK